MGSASVRALSEPAADRRRLHVEHLTVGLLECTCTIVGDPATGEAIVVDGGDNVPEIAARLNALGLRAKYLLHTHAHIDHIGALGELRDTCGGSALLHPDDLPLYGTLALQARWMGLVQAPPIVKLDADLRDGDAFTAGAVTLRALHTPGHTPGSTSFALEFDGSTPLLLTGDTLFRGGVGRWDLGGTSLADIVTSINSKLLAYADETIVVPGHGPATTIGAERRDNPYLAAHA
jgi:glyoxylase-like metal-dependent hydrolase (beta-lactamase superfamily II)